MLAPPMRAAAPTWLMVMKEQFTLAQAELNVTNGISNPESHFFRNQTQLHNEYCVAELCGVMLVYTRLYKAGNDEICGHISAYKRGSQQLYTQDGDHVRNRCMAVPCLFFSFVREPFSHLVSGYSETQYRNQLSVNQFKFKMSPKAFVKEILATGWSKLGPHAAHALPQTSLLLRPSISSFRFIGRLEALAADWDVRLGNQVREISGDAYCEIRPWGNLPNVSTRHSHTSITSGFEPRAQMEMLLSTESPYQLAMCRVLLPDFTCFDYPLPSACAAIGLNLVAKQMRSKCGELLSIRPGALLP